MPQFKHICVSISDDDLNYIQEMGYSPTKLLRIKIEELKNGRG